mmetsp:Transcript_5541/g.11181  ORF Transcript_5541/g.11181 Transcript_5541/m.11181 type:complete len:84 (-) Transcript_5541:402-653(-)
MDANENAPGLRREQSHSLTSDENVSQRLRPIHAKVSKQIPSCRSSQDYIVDLNNLKKRVDLFTKGNDTKVKLELRTTPSLIWT